jgi:hypothetical protein
VVGGAFRFKLPVPFSTIQNPRSAHCWAQEMRSTFRPDTSKIGNQFLGDLNETIWVVFNLRCCPDTRRLMWRGVWLVALQFRMLLSLRTWRFILWGHAFYGSNQDFGLWSHTLHCCLLFFVKSFVVFLLWGNFTNECSIPPTVRISMFVTAALRSVYCRKPWALLTPDVSCLHDRCSLWWD